MPVVVALGRRVAAVEKEEEIFRVGIVGKPAGAGVNLEIAAVHFVLKARPGVLLDFHADAKLLDLALLKLGHLARLRIVGGHVDCQLQLRAAFRIPSIWVAGFGHHLFCEGKVVLFVGVFERRVVSGDARRQELLRVDVHAVEENLVPKILVVGGRDGLAQLAVFSDDRVVHVEDRVERPRLNVAGQLHTALAVFSGQLQAGRHHGAEHILADGRAVEVALPEQEPNRDDFADDWHLHLVHERNRHARERPQARLGLRFPPGFREARRRVSREPREAEQPAAPPFDETKRAGADGVELELVARARLAVVFFSVEILDRLARNRCREGHREPVLNLRIRLEQVDAERVTVERLDAGQRF